MASADCQPRKRVAVLGSTGSIGTSCLDVIAAQRDRFELIGLTANRSGKALADQCRRFSPRIAVLSDAASREELSAFEWPKETSLSFGSEGIESLASHPDVDIVVCGIVGAAGLRGAWAAVESGKRVAIANKETLVVAGPLVMQLAKKTGSELIPVDSEHSAIFQSLLSGRRDNVKRVVLTASGGPFRGWSKSRLENEATIERALAHPTWRMGPKITIDSATMMNKALEIIEARWLFGLTADQIGVVVHPQSIIHSFVEFVDGSVIAQLSPPDMKLPIQYALTYPERLPGINPPLDWMASHQLEFYAPDLEAFPALQLGFDVARTGGSSGAVLNAANEVAVERFLEGTLKFTDIPRACREILNAHNHDASPSLSELLKQDAKAREEMKKWMS